MPPCIRLLDVISQNTASSHLGDLGKPKLSRFFAVVCQIRQNFSLLTCPHLATPEPIMGLLKKGAATSVANALSMLNLRVAGFARLRSSTAFNCLQLNSGESSYSLARRFGPDKQLAAALVRCLIGKIIRERRLLVGSTECTSNR